MLLSKITSISGIFFVERYEDLYPDATEWGDGWNVSCKFTPILNNPNPNDVHFNPISMTREWDHDNGYDIWDVDSIKVKSYNEITAPISLKIEVSLTNSITNKSISDNDITIIFTNYIGDETDYTDTIISGSNKIVEIPKLPTGSNGNEIYINLYKITE